MECVHTFLVQNFTLIIHVILQFFFTFKFVSAQKLYMYNYTHTYFINSL